MDLRVDWLDKMLVLLITQVHYALWVSQRARKNGVFCHVSHAPLLPLSLDRFPPNFPQTRVQEVARDTWFHIPEKFPLRDRICRKPSFRVPHLWSGYGSRETFCDAYTVSIPWWASHRCALPGWLLLRDVPFSSYPTPKVSLSAMAMPGWGNSRAIWREAGH